MDRLVMSRGVAANASIDDVLLAAIPGAMDVKAATLDEDRQGIDKWVELYSGKLLGVDVKVRSSDYAQWGRDDLALELWSVVEEKVPGWTRDSRKRTDYVLWWWQTTGRWCLVPFPLLCTVFIEHADDWEKRYQVAEQATDGRYRSRCVFVPRLIVWRAIYDRFGGAPLQDAA